MQHADRIQLHFFQGGKTCFADVLIDIVWPNMQAIVSLILSDFGFNKYADLQLSRVGS